MATVNKDFKIKSGLIVEGTSGTINGYDILTEDQASIDFIVEAAGGGGTRDNTPDTLVKRDGFGNFAAGQIDLDSKLTAPDVRLGNAGQIHDNDGDLEVSAYDGNTLQLRADGDVQITSSNSDIVLNADGTTYLNSASAGNEVATRSYADNVASTEANTAEQNAKDYADGLASNYDPAGSAQGAYNNAVSYADGLASNYDAAGAASTAETNANNYTNTALEDYTPTSSLDTTIDGYGYLKSADLSGYATESYVGTAIDNLVDGAPGLLDTLNELAAAINDDANYATTLTTALGTKQDNLTASTGITIDGSNNISVTANTYDAYGSASTAESNANDYTDTAITNLNLGTTYDAYGAAATAEDNANSYTDGEITTALTTAQGYATTAYDNAVSYADNLTTDDVAEGNNVYFTEARVNDVLTTSTQTNISITEDINGHLVITAENGVDDSTTDDLAEGETNLYFTNSRVIDAVDNANITPQTVQIDTFRKEEATQTYFSTASTATVHSFGSPFGSVKYIVRVVGNVSGTLHSQITEILATVDGNNNVAVTEFGSIHTTEPALASFEVDYDSGTSQFRLRATTVNSGSEVIVAATLLSWAD